MPPQKKVSTLVVLAREKVLYDICAIVLHEVFFSEDDEWEVFGPPYLSLRLQAVKDILSNSLGPNIMQDILNIILERDDVVEPSVRYLSLQLLLTEGVKKLTVSHFPESYYSFVLEAIAESAANLELLDLKGLWVRENDKFSLYKALRRLQRVKHLIIRYVCDDEILKVIGKHCWNLERLDLSGSNKITLNGITSLVSRPSQTSNNKGSRNITLKIVDIGGPGAQNLPVDIITELIEGLPNLLSLGSFDKTGLALKRAHENSPNSTYKLRYIHDMQTKSEIISILCKTCPDLQAIYLNSPGTVALEHLDMLKQLTELKLNRIKWSNVSALLEKCGDRIRSIILLTVWGQLDLIKLGTLCPGLLRLELHSVSLSCSDTNHSRALKKVTDLMIYYSQISTTCVKFILNQSLAMEHISLGQCGQLTDAAIISSLMDHSLQKAHSIWFGLAENLTLRTIQALLEHCKELTNLGNLAAWNVRQEDVAILREQLYLSNMDLTLHDLGPEEEEGDLLVLIPP